MTTKTLMSKDDATVVGADVWGEGGSVGGTVGGSGGGDGAEGPRETACEVKDESTRTLGGSSCGSSQESSLLTKCQTLLPGDIIAPETASDILQYTRGQCTDFLPNGGGSVTRTGGIVVPSPYRHGGLHIFGRAKVYTPQVGEYVIGFVEKKLGMQLKIDINSTFSAVLDTVEGFRGATKRYRPHLAIGTALYVQVHSVHRDLETVVSCDLPWETKNWTSGQSYCGELVGGLIVDVPIWYAHSLLGDRCYVMERLGRSIGFEAAVGLNGRVWIKANSPQSTILLVNVLQKVHSRPLTQMEAIISKALSTMV